MVNGREWRGWFRRGGLPDTDASPGRLTLHLALLGADLAQQVGAGENQGRRLVQDFSVLRLSRSRSEEGRWEMFTPKVPGDQGRLALVAWVSRDGDLTPLQAVGGWFEPK